MHYFHRSEIAMEYARTASCRSTEVIAMPQYGDQLGIEMTEDGYLNLYFPHPQEDPEDESSRESDPAGSFLAEDDPFLESDLPLTQLTEPPDPSGPDQEEAPPKA